MKSSSKCKSEMFGRKQWKHLAKVSQSMKNKSEMLGRMQWRHLANVSQKC